MITIDVLSAVTVVIVGWLSSLAVPSLIAPTLVVISSIPPSPDCRTNSVAVILPLTINISLELVSSVPITTVLATLSVLIEISFAVIDPILSPAFIETSPIKLVVDLNTAFSETFNPEFIETSPPTINPVSMKTSPIT